MIHYYCRVCNHIDDVPDEFSYASNYATGQRNIAANQFIANIPSPREGVILFSASCETNAKIIVSRKTNRDLLLRVFEISNDSGDAAHFSLNPRLYSPCKGSRQVSNRATSTTRRCGSASQHMIYHTDFDLSPSMTLKMLWPGFRQSENSLPYWQKL